MKEIPLLRAHDPDQRIGKICRDGVVELTADVTRAQIFRMFGDAGVRITASYVDASGTEYVRECEIVEFSLLPPMVPSIHAQLISALEDCANRFERCCVHSGSDKEFAAHAVEDYRALVKAARNL